MTKQILKILFIIITSPVLIWFLMHPKAYLSEWKKTPEYFSNNIRSVISSDKLAKVDEERWNAFGPAREDKLSKIYYNKGLVLVDDFFSILSNLSPRLYFQSGDGTKLSPSKVEPIAIPLFVFWLIGIVSFLKGKNYKVILLPAVIAVAVYFVGQRNMAYLLPISIIYSLISVNGLESLKNIKAQKIIRISLILYGLFLIGRMFLIK